MSTPSVLNEYPTLTLPFLGVINAGWQFAIEDEVKDSISFDEWLGANRNSSFIMSVATEAMIDAGIQSGDMAVIERGKRPQANDIVLAQQGSDSLLRYYMVSKEGPYLVPANGNYDLLEIDDSIEITGVVTAIVRRYHH